jgi:hypothetical protein
MRRFAILICGSVLLTQVFAQNYVYNVKNRYYGVNIYQSLTGSGYGASTNISVNVQKFNRLLELGLIFNNKTRDIRGFELLYKHFLGFSSSNFYNKTLKPYVYYNFLYRTPAEVIVSPSLSQSTDIYSYEIGGKRTTFEDAVGLGIQITIIKQVYIESCAGFGVYFGSHYQGSTPHSWGIHLNNYGFVPSVKLGLGLHF